MFSDLCPKLKTRGVQVMLMLGGMYLHFIAVVALYDGANPNTAFQYILRFPASVYDYMQDRYGFPELGSLTLLCNVAFFGVLYASIGYSILTSKVRSKKYRHSVNR